MSAKPERRRRRPRSGPRPGATAPSPADQARPLLPLAIFVVALLVKLTVVLQLHDHPLLQPVGGLDSEAYVGLGRRVAAGDLLLGREPYYLAPLYAYFLAIVFALGGGVLAALTTQAVLGSLAVVLVFLTAHRLAGTRAGLAAAAAAILAGSFTFHEAVLLQSALDPLLTALALYLLVVGLDGGRPSVWLAAGVVFGALALNRPNALLPAAVAALLLAVVVRRPRAALLFCAGLVSAVAPVTLRNITVSGEPVVIASHGGLNFYIGNNEEADGTYHSVAGIRPNIAGQETDARQVAERGLGRRLGASEVSAYFYRRAWQWIASQPGAAAALFVRKLALTFNEAELALNYSYRYYSRDEPTLLRALVIGPALLVPLGIVGLVSGARRLGPKATLTWAVFVPAYALSVAAFFVSARYRLPLLVPLCIGTGLAVDLICRHGQEPRRLLPAAVLAGALAVLAIWHFGLDEGRASERTEMVLHLVDTGREAEALTLLPQIETDDPQPGLLFYRVGRALLERGRAREAADLLARALATDGPKPEIRLALGQALLDQGGPANAIPHLEAARQAGVRPELAAFDLARALLALNQREQAIVVLRQMAPPADAASLLALGQLALELDEPELAESFLRPAVQLSPTLAAAREKLGVALAMQGRAAEAAEQLEHARHLAPGDAAVRLNLAVAYGQLGRLAEAVAQAEEALRLRPDYPPAASLLDDLRRGK